MDLPVLSAACERPGPTRNAIKCPDSIHFVHAYYTQFVMPEYLNRTVPRYI